MWDQANLCAGGHFTPLCVRGRGLSTRLAPGHQRGARDQREPFVARRPAVGAVPGSGVSAAGRPRAAGAATTGCAALALTGPGTCADLIARLAVLAGRGSFRAAPPRDRAPTIGAFGQHAAPGEDAGTSRCPQLSHLPVPGRVVFLAVPAADVVSCNPSRRARLADALAECPVGFNVWSAGRASGSRPVADHPASEPRELRGAREDAGHLPTPAAAGTYPSRGGRSSSRSRRQTS